MFIPLSKHTFSVFVFCSFFLLLPLQLSQPGFLLLCEEGVISGSVKAGNIPVAWEFFFNIDIITVTVYLYSIYLDQE